MAISVFIVDDHPVFRKGIKKMLEAHDSIIFSGEADNGEEAIEAVEKLKPEVVVMDISMPGMDGIEASRRILTLAPDTKILAFTIHSGKSYVRNMLDAGAKGYMLKDSDPEELISAIESLSQGNMYLSPAITGIALSPDESIEETKLPGILNTKLHRPPISNDHVIRKDIIEYLQNNVDKPFSLIAAPAGYGKSSVASQWLEHSNANYAWISLDEEHNDLRTFLRYLCAAVEKIFPSSLDNTSILINASAFPPVKVLAHTLINELDAIEEDFILVLDDYHMINEVLIHSLLDELLRFPPENMHLSILTRKDPPLKLNTLLAHNRLVEIRMDKLSFSNTEIINLFKQLHNITLSDETAVSLYKKTEGWIVGLRLAFMNIGKPEEIDDILSSLRGDVWSLSSFLIEEIIKKQPDVIQESLLITSVLNRFNAGLIDELNRGEDKNNNKKSLGVEFIPWLLKSNLFIVALDANQKWFRYHHLFQDLLVTELKKIKTVEEINTYHMRASHWFEKHGSIEDAIHHALAGNNPDEACSIIERHRWAELSIDKWFVVQRWLSFLPDDLIWESPELLLSETWCAYENFTLEKIPALLEQAKSLLKDNEKDRALLGEYYLINGLIMHWSGMGEAALELFSKAEDLLPDIKNLALGMLHLHIALARGATGRQALAIEDVSKQLSVTGGEDAVYDTRLMAGIYYVNIFAGNLQKARREAQIVQKTASESKIAYTYAMGICMEGTACFHAYQLKEAENLFAIASENRYNLHIGTALDAMAGHALTLQFLGNKDKADEALNLLDSFEKEMLQTNTAPISNSCRARILSLRGDGAPALVWAEKLEAPPSFAGLFIWLEVPILTQARVLIHHGSNGSLQKAQKHLDEFLAVSKTNHLNNQIIEGMVLQAVLLQRQGQEEAARKKLLEVINLAEPGGWIRPFVEAGPAMTEILQKLPGEKTAYTSGLLDAIEKTHNQQNLIEEQREPPTQQKENAPIESEPISIRELDVIRLLAEGLRNKEIAVKLYVSEGTIKKHIYNICQKWQVNNRIQLLSKAKELGVI